MLPQPVAEPAHGGVHLFKCPHCHRIQKYGAEPAADFSSVPIPEASQP